MEVKHGTGHVGPFRDRHGFGGPCFDSGISGRDLVGDYDCHIWVV